MKTREFAVSTKLADRDTSFELVVAEFDAQGVAGIAEIIYYGVENDAHVWVVHSDA